MNKAFSVLLGAQADCSKGFQGFSGLGKFVVLTV